MGPDGVASNQVRRSDPGSRPKRLTVLGATGSIGQNTLDLVARTPQAFDIVALTAQSNAEQLAELAIRSGAKLAVVGDPECYQVLKARLAGSGIRAAAGPAALIEAATEPADCVIAAIVGAAGLAPTLAAVKQGCRIALANKECLVAAGELFKADVARYGAELFPVDSEHSAAFQAIGASALATIEKIVLTASGGPFREWGAEQLKTATPDAAVKHPKWSMGAKISVDSATMMNKGLELIEAFHLFPVRVSQLGVVVHPQSIVHCLVSFADGSVLAQLAEPDMRTPISLALAWPARMHAPTKRLDLTEIGALTFEKPDEVRFPALRIARSALERGGTAPAVLNAANEIAVAAFLSRRISFLDIADLVESVLDQSEARGLVRSVQSLADILELDRDARALAVGMIERYVYRGA